MRPPIILWLMFFLSTNGQNQVETPNVNGYGNNEQSSSGVEPPRRRYPNRSSNYYDPGSAFRNPGNSFEPSTTSVPRDPFKQNLNSFKYEPYPTNNNSQSNIIVTRRTTPTTTLRTTEATTVRSGKPTRSPFDNPNRYKMPQANQQSDQVRFVNGRPYRENPNIQDRYGNRYDPRFHSIPGEYDPENDPRFSDPRYQDPRNVPKYNNNRQRQPQDRYDSKYRYYERFPDRQRDRIRDPNYDPRWDPDDPPVPGVLGGWLPELQGECRHNCENLPRDITVNTNYGRVNGFYVYLYDGPRVQEFDRPGVANVDKIKNKVSVFLGIPYAQAPIGEARLMPPRPHRGWQSYDAVDWAPVCPQPVRFVGATKNAPHMDEDCLYLNIYSPTVDSGQAQKFPVMFYIHGGQFMHGSGNDFPGHQLAVNGRVVVVTINYRLGALGFLSTGDHHAPGNYGLLDMAMALKWTYDNIIAFQGDRERITVFGPGAGAASAGLLAIMPRSKSMVRRVIATSGSPLADWAVINDKFRAMNTSLVYGERIGCTIDNSWKLVDCIRRGRSFAEISNVEFKPEIGTWPWAPVVQKNISVPEDEWYEEWTSDDFIALPELVSVAYENQNYNPLLQYMTGVARDDAAYMIYDNKTLAPNYNIGWDFFDMMVRDHIMQYNYTLNPDGIFGAIKYMYTYYPDPNNKSHIREEFINFYSDYFYKAPQDAIVKTLVRNRVDTYMYVQNTTVEALKLPWWRQITHNLEHYFLSGAPFMDSVFFPEDHRVSRHLWTEGDRNMSEFFIYAWANFSWYGNPTQTNILGVHWDMAKQGEILEYLAVNTTENSTTLWNYRQRECAFWTEYLPTVIGYITPTYPPTTEFWWEPDSPLQIAFWSISSACLILCVMVVVCCLLWRNAKRQAKDRYFDGGGSIKEYPSTMHMDNFSTVESHFSHAKSEPAGMRSRTPDPGMRSASVMDPLMTMGQHGGPMNGTMSTGITGMTIGHPQMTGTLQSHLSTQPTVIMPNGTTGIMQGMPAGMQMPQAPIVMTSSASMNMLPHGSVPVLSYPSQPPLPPVPTSMGGHQPMGQQPTSMGGQPTMPIINNGGMMPRNISTDNLGGIGKYIDSPHLSSSGRGSTRIDSSESSSGRPVTPPLKTSRPVTPQPAPAPQPLGLPTHRGKLVPGRMSNHKLDSNRPQSAAGRNREIPSTAV